MNTKWYITSIDVSVRSLYPFSTRSNHNDCVFGIDVGFKILPVPTENIKPYLRSGSKITIEELYKLETDLLRNYVYDIIEQNHNINIETLYDYLLDKHHFDRYGLIEEGFAIEAPKEMY